MIGEADRTRTSIASSGPAALREQLRRWPLRALAAGGGWRRVRCQAFRISAGRSVCPDRAQSSVHIRSQIIAAVGDHHGRQVT